MCNLCAVINFAMLPLTIFTPEKKTDFHNGQPPSSKIAWDSIIETLNHWRCFRDLSLTSYCFLQINNHFWWFFGLWYTLPRLLLEISQTTRCTKRLVSPFWPNTSFWVWICFWNLAMYKDRTGSFHTVSTNLFEIQNLKIIEFWAIFFAFHSSNIEI